MLRHIIRKALDFLSFLYKKTNNKKNKWIIEDAIEKLVCIFNDLQDEKRRKCKTPREAIRRYPYITIWQWTLEDGE